MGYYGDEDLGPGEMEWYPPNEEEPPLDVEVVGTEPYEETVGSVPPDYRKSKRPGSDPYDEGECRRAIDLPCKDFGNVKGCGAEAKQRCHFQHQAIVREGTRKRVQEITGERSMPCLARLKWAARP